MVSSRDRITSAPNDPLRRVNRQSAAACVSLSKSTMSKTRTAIRGPTCLAPRRRRRRRFREPRTPCQPLFSEILQNQDRSLKTAKNHRKENQEAFLLTVRRFDWSAETKETNPEKQEVSQLSLSPKSPETSVPKASVAGPFPSEAALYGPPFSAATRF